MIISKLLHARFELRMATLQNPVLWMLFMNINNNYVVFSTQNAKKDFFEFRDNL